MHDGTRTNGGDIYCTFLLQHGMYSMMAVFNDDLGIQIDTHTGDKQLWSSRTLYLIFKSQISGNNYCTLLSQAATVLT